MSESRIVHVVPCSDEIAHDTSTEDLDCVCGPCWQMFEYDDQPDGWAIVHASLDGREKQEQVP